MMQKYVNTQNRETTNDIIVHELTDENSGSTFAKEYLKSGFVSSAVDQLFYARRQADLTQAQVAEQMNTKQAAIARLEADANGSMSLRRYAEFALAFGIVPLDIVLVPIESARNFVIANPDLPLTQINYDTWLLTKETRFIPAPQNMQPAVILSQPTIAMSQTAKTSTQNRAEYGDQLQNSAWSGVQSTSNQYGGRLAA